MRFEVEFDREDHGRWIAEIVNLPGAMAYGATREEAVGSSGSNRVEGTGDRLESQHESLKASIEFAGA